MVEDEPREEIECKGAAELGTLLRDQPGRVRERKGRRDDFDWGGGSVMVGVGWWPALLRGVG